MDEKNQLILSFSDLAHALKKKSSFLLLSALLLAIFLFYHQLKKPVHYTAEGIFKSGNNIPAPSLSKALEFFGASESYASSDDPRTFLRCFPVMEKVAKSLNLQAKITNRKQKKSRAYEFWKTWKAEQWVRHLKHGRPDAHVMSYKSLMADRPFFEDKRPEIECTHVNYTGEFSRTFTLVFLDKTTFEVFEHKKKIGKGQLEIPFLHENGEFTLSSSDASLKKKEFSLSLIPLSLAAKSLEDLVVVKKEKENPSLCRVRFTHTNPLLAKNIVNAVMMEFQNFLKEEGKQKITKQLGYLKQRQKEAFQELEVVMEKHKSYLQDHVDAGGLLVLEKELEFFAKSQEMAQTELRRISADIEDIQKVHPLFSGYSFTQLRDLFKEENHHLLPKTMTQEIAKALLLKYQQQLEQILFEKTTFETCSLQLLEPTFDSMAYSKVLGDALIQERFERIHEIERKLVDEKNFSEKERATLRSHLDTEKDFLIKKLAQLTKGAEVQASLIKERISLLQENLLSLLFSQYDSVEKRLHELNLKAENFPEKWLTEQKITLNTKIHCELMESITKIIETKNIGYHLEYSNASPLMMAPMPLIPDHPKLFFRFFVGGMIGLFFASLVVVFRETFLGATASSHNLFSFGAVVCGTFNTPTKQREKNTIKHLLFHLCDKGKKIAILSQKEHQLGVALQDAYLKEGKRVELIGYAEFIKKGTQDKQSFIVLNTYPKSPDAAGLIQKCDGVIYVVHNERLKELDHLPKDTLYVHCQRVKKRKAKTYTIREILPKLEKLFKVKPPSSFSFFSGKSPKIEQ